MQTCEQIACPPPIRVNGEPALRMDWLDQIRRLQQYVIDSPYFSWGVAAYVQVLLLIVLGALMLRPVVKQEPVSITVSFSESGPPVDEEVAEVVITPPEEEPEPEPELEVPQPELPELPEDEPTERPEPNEVEPTLVEKAAEVEAVPIPQGSVDTDSPPSELQSKSRESPKPEPPKVRAAPPQATIVGAFSAWTEPEFPEPGEPYVIVIQVTLPERVKRYSSSDLSGVIIGADGYRKFIRGSNAEWLPIVDHTARIRVPIVGAERAWKDSIVIQSRILRQRQLIELNYAAMW